MARWIEANTFYCKFRKGVVIWAGCNYKDILNYAIDLWLTRLTDEVFVNVTYESSKKGLLSTEEKKRIEAICHLALTSNSVKAKTAVLMRVYDCSMYLEDTKDSTDEVRLSDVVEVAKTVYVFWGTKLDLL